MFLFAICFNLTLACFNSYLAVQLGLSRNRLQRLTRTLNRLERCSHRYLNPLPTQGQIAQHSTQILRLKYQRLRRQWLILQKLGLLGQLFLRVSRSPRRVPGILGH